MKKNKNSTQRDITNNPDTSFIDFMRGLGFCTGAEALEQYNRQRKMEFIKSKERQDGLTEDQEKKE